MYALCEFVLLVYGVSLHIIPKCLMKCTDDSYTKLLAQTVSSVNRTPQKYITS
jgi:hypothetical protein